MASRSLFCLASLYSAFASMNTGLVDVLSEQPTKTNTNSSDIDIAYIENDKTRLNFESYLKLENELEKIFNAKIDLINYKKFNPLIKLHSEKDFIYV